MAMPIIIVTMLVIAMFYGYLSGNLGLVAAASMDGAGAAADFLLKVGPLICLWSGVMEVLRKSGAMAALAAALRPPLRLLFPGASRDRETMEALSANVSANLLGLGNAATPMGVKAAGGMARLGEPGTASDELCTLVVLNTASLQLLPTTVASVRAAAGAAAPFDILLPVWLASACSVAVGLCAAKLCAALWRGRGR